MRILHTADWHIGQLFHGYDRTYEHQEFLKWLLERLKIENIDVLLISGDVFDVSNPSSASIRMFYTFLNKAVNQNNGLQIIVTAGNHDSASRLEAPKPLLESSSIEIIGQILRDQEGNIDYSKLVIPLRSRSGTQKAWCMAIPFLRIGDYPAIANAANTYAAGVTALYADAFEYTCSVNSDQLPVICMGHLHTQKAEITDLDKSERPIMGGIECVSDTAFNEKIQYVALGHIHKAQKIGGKEHIRYSGSPLPMSFSELNYKHQVVVFDLNTKGIQNLQSLEVPLTVSLLSVPSKHSRMETVLEALRQLPNAADSPPGKAPYLNVRVLLDGPEPALKHSIENALEGKDVRLAKIDVRYPSVNVQGEGTMLTPENNLDDLNPLDIFTKAFTAKYSTDAPETLIELFNQVTVEVTEVDNQ